MILNKIHIRCASNHGYVHKARIIIIIISSISISIISIFIIVSINHLISAIIKYQTRQTYLTGTFTLSIVNLLFSLLLLMINFKFNMLIIVYVVELLWFM